MELNASDDRGIDVVREQIKNFASSKRMVFGANAEQRDFKLIILDEADMMTQAAQGALRRGSCLTCSSSMIVLRCGHRTVIEQYTQNVRFCIICNYVNRIIPAIQSRCTKFRFAYMLITLLWR